MKRFVCITFKSYLLALLLFANFSALVLAEVPALMDIPSTCGNGQVDEGEECDYTALGDDISASCCRADCKFATAGISCENGMGVCNQGRCTSRASSCLQYSGNIMRFPEPLMPGNISAISSPWSTCYPKVDSIDINLVIEKENGVVPDDKTIIDQIIPEWALSASRCDLSCSGSTPEGEKVCVKFQDYTNLPNDVSDGLTCFGDGTPGMNFIEFSSQLKEASSDSMRNVEIFNKALLPGICNAGSCVSDGDSCGQNYCSGKGQCIVGPSVQIASRKIFDLPEGNISVGRYSGIVQCMCDDGFSGVACEINIPEGMEFTPIVNVDKIFSRSDLNSAIVASVFGTLAVTLFLIALILFFDRYWIRPNESKFDKEAQIEHTKQTFFDKGGPVKPADPQFNNSPVSFVTEEESGAPTPGWKPDERSASEDVSESDEQSSHEDSKGPKTRSVGEVDQIFSAGASLAYNNSVNNSLESNPSASSQQIPPNYLRASHSYKARLADEIDLNAGDILYLIKSFDDGWAKAYNIRTGKEGVFPKSFSRRVSLKSKPLDENKEEEKIESDEERTSSLKDNEE